MQYESLGATDLKVSKICLGTMTFGEQNSEKEAHEQLAYAVDRGVNFIDTAELYAVPSNKDNNGLTEKYIGTWLKDRSDRDRLVVATKVAGPPSSGSGLEYIRNPLGFSRSQIHEAVEGSLKRLQTDYIDLYQLHWPERKANFFGKLDYKHPSNEKWEDNFADILTTLDGLVKAGKIRHYGVSNETPWGLHRYFYLADQMKVARPVSIQNPYSLLNRSFEVGLSEMAIRESCGLLAYSPLGFGLLSGKYHDNKASASDRLNKFKVMSRYNGERAQQATAEYLEIAKKHDLSLTQMSLSFVNTRSFLTSNIIGATSIEQLKENIESIEVELSEEVLDAIEKVHSGNPNPAP